MSKLTKEAILKALENVDDPASGNNIVVQDMVKSVYIDGNKVAVTIQLSKEAAEMRSAIKKGAESSIKIFAGDAAVSVNIQGPEPPPLTKATNPMMAGQQDALPNVKQIIAVASGKGGVGKSTVAVNLAIGLAQGGAKVGLLDADIYGPSAPIMFGIQGERPMMRNDGKKGKIVPIQKFGVEVMSIGLLVDEKQAMIWRGPMATSALRQFVSDVDWGELDYLVLDLPPGTGDIHLTVVQTLPIAGAVIVTTPQSVAMADAKKGIMMFKQGSIDVPILGIVENMAYFSPAELPDNKYYIFGKNGGKQLAEQFDLPFLAEIPIVQSIRQGGDQGVPSILDDEALSKHCFTLLADRVKAQLRRISSGKELIRDFDSPV